MTDPTAAIHDAHAEAPTKETERTSIGTGLGWHFSTGELGYGDGRKIAAGVTHTVDDDEPVLCAFGLHDSMRILDALRHAPRYAPGYVLARTRLGGAVVVGDDKRCGTERTYLAVIDASAILHEFACRLAERAMKRAGNPDPRSVAAIAAKRAWLRGEMTDEQLAVAWAASIDAAWAAGRAVARAAAIDAARAASIDAARAVVSAASIGAARAAAIDAARAVTWGVNRAATWAAAWAFASAFDSSECQNDELTRIAFESLAEVGYTEEQAAQ